MLFAVAANSSSDAPSGPHVNTGGFDLLEDTSKEEPMDTLSEGVQGTAGGSAGPRSSVKPGASAEPSRNRSPKPGSRGGKSQSSVPEATDFVKPGVSGIKSTRTNASITGRSSSLGRPAHWD